MSYTVIVPKPVQKQLLYQNEEKMEIGTKIDSEQAQKLAFIQEKTQQNLDEILRVALEDYYEKVLNNSSNYLKKFSKIGFVGCIEAEPDLAEHCEEILRKEILTTCKK